MPEIIDYVSDGQNLDRIRRALSSVRSENRGSRDNLLRSLAYEFKEAGLKFKTGREIQVEGLSFHIYDPFLADILVGYVWVTKKLLNRFPDLENGQRTYRVLIMPRGQIENTPPGVDIVYCYGESSC